MVFRYIGIRIGLGFVYIVVSLVLETRIGIYERIEELKRGRLRTYEGVVLEKPRVRRFGRAYTLRDKSLEREALSRARDKAAGQSGPFRPSCVARAGPLLYRS